MSEQCKWVAKLLLNGVDLPGFYGCSLPHGHRGWHHLPPENYNTNAVIDEWFVSRTAADGLVSVGRKDDSGKLRYDLVDPYALAWLVASLTYGVTKYAAWNWNQVEGWRERYHAALLRHIEAWRAGEDDDEESGLPHLANAMFCVMCLTAMSAPRDMKVVIARTKEAIRRWRETVR